MSTIEQLEQKQKDLRAEMKNLKERGEEWQAKREARIEALENAVIDDDPTYKKTVQVEEAKAHVSALGKRYGEKKRELEEIERRLLEERYHEGYEEMTSRRARALESMMASNKRLITAAKEEFDGQVETAVLFNDAAREFNRLAKRAQLPRIEGITRLNSHDLSSFVAVLMRTYELEGLQAISEEPVMPLPSGTTSTRGLNVDLPSNRRSQ